MLLRPSYDPQALEWFTEDGRVSASLAELLLHRGEVIADYKRGSSISHAAVRLLDPKVAKEPPQLRQLPEPPRQEPEPRPADRAVVGFSSPSSPVPTEKKPRKRRDPLSYRTSRWSEADDNEIISLAKHGYTAGQIASVMKRTRNAIIGRLHRIEAKGGGSLLQRARSFGFHRADDRTASS